MLLAPALLPKLMRTAVDAIGVRGQPVRYGSLGARGAMTTLKPEDLTPLERTYLGVLATGLVPADLARDTRFRMEFITAVCHAMVEGLPEGGFLGDEEFTASTEFRHRLRKAIVDLDLKQVIGVGAPQDVVIMKPSVTQPEALYGQIDLNRHPPIFDRYLSQRCMDELMELPSVHLYLMALYADSGDIWHELYKQGYGQYR